MDIGTAIYTRTVMDAEEPHKPASIETSHRREDGKVVRVKGHAYHHGAPPEDSHHEAACNHRWRYTEIYCQGGEMRAAPANDGRHDFIFI